MRISNSITIALYALLESAAVVTAAHAGTSGFSELYTFCQQPNCTDGQLPLASLVADNEGNLYGTTRSGGEYGYGTVFELSPTGTETVLYSFCANCTEAPLPESNLVRDTAGNLYGTTAGGGANGMGTVFKLTPSGTETVLYSFCGAQDCADGADPIAGVVMDREGNLYGTTLYGGSNELYGTVFELSTSGTETVLWSFNGTDGAVPYAGLLMKGRYLYGTTHEGGAYGYGTVFRLTRKGVGTVLYSFCAQEDCVDGASPDANLAVDKTGNLYGTTSLGGANSAGTVFELTSSGTESAIYSFCAQQDCTDGAYPYAGLHLRSSKTGVISLYGTTQSGGASGYGTAFAIRAGAETVLHSFARDSCAVPQANLIMVNGYFFGTSTGNGEPGCVFKLGSEGDAAR